jgi:hypothetical protein
MAVTRTPTYLCDYCQEPVDGTEGLILSRYVVWNERDDPRKRPGVAPPVHPFPPAIRPKVLHNERRPDAKHDGTFFNVTSPMFPIPRSARGWELLLHEQCAANLVKGRLAELADAG